MNQMIEVSCSHCGEVNSFPVSDLVSGMPITDDNGNVVVEHPEIDFEEGILIQCSRCNYPIPVNSQDLVNE